MATDIIARGMITEYKSGTNISFKENEDGSVTISASGDVSSEDTVARETIDNHKLDKNNPHNVTAEQIGLGNVDNTADLDKPISTAVQTALDKKVNKTDIKDNLESTDTASPLSANQGKVLNEKIAEHTGDSDVHVTTADKSNWNGYASEIEANKTDISQLFDITRGGEIVNNESSYSLDNAVDYPLLGLNLYGKSVQDGVPTPENPVEIISVGDNGFDIITKNDNHFNLLSVRDNGGEIITKQPVSIVGKVGNIVGITVAATGTGLKYQWQLSADKGQTWKNSISTGNNSPTISLTISPTWNGIHLRCVITDANGKAEISNNAVIYVVSDDCEINTASITTALPLCGIPVESGGNYTDSNGQQWFCDELIYNADGTGKIVKRCDKIKLTSANIISFTKDATYGSYFRTNIKSVNNDVQSVLRPISNAFEGVKFIDRTNSDYINKFRCFLVPEENIIIRNSVLANDKFASLADMKNFVDTNDVYVIYPLYEPQEMELTAAEMTALRQLQTFNGITNISNDGGADMNVKFCTNKMLSECATPVFNGLQAEINDRKPVLLFEGDVAYSADTANIFDIPSGKKLLIIIPMITITSGNYDGFGTATVIDTASLTNEYMSFSAVGFSVSAGTRNNNGYISINGSKTSVYFDNSSADVGAIKVYAI